jgi:hypothetical protein
MNPNPEGGPPQQKNWFSRNWKWLVPLGCFGPLLCCGVFSAVASFGATTMIESSPVFTTALARANANPDVQAAMGTPLVPGFGLNGSVDEKSGRGSARFTIPVKGSKAEGKLRVVATSKGGTWTYSVMELEAGAKTFNLLEEEGNPRDELLPPDELPPPDADEPEPADPDGD